MAGCAYHRGLPKRALPGGFTKIAIPIFSNLTQEPTIEVPFTQALIAELEKSKIAQLTDPRFAEVIALGKIKSVEYLPSGRREGGGLPLGAVLASEYRIVLTMELSLKKVSDQTIVWSSVFQGERTYIAPQVTQPVVNTVNANYNHSARRLNIETLSKQMVAEAYSQMTEGF